LQKKKKTPTGSKRKSLKKRNLAKTKTKVSDSKPQVKFTYSRKFTRSKATDVLNPEAIGHKVKKDKCKGIDKNIFVAKVKINIEKK